MAMMKPKNGAIGRSTKPQAVKLKKSDMATPVKEDHNYMTRGQYGLGKRTKKR